MTDIDRTSNNIIQFTESMNDLEIRLNSMKNEVDNLRELRLAHKCSSRSKLTSSNLDTDDSTNDKCLDADGNLIEKLNRQIEFLEENNSNVSEELNEYKNAFFEKSTECELYREKYLKAQKLADDYYRKNNNLITEFENQNQYNRNHKSDLNVNDNEIGRLTFALETTEIEYKEIQSKLKIAERTITALSNDLQSCIIKCERFQKDLENAAIKNSRLNVEVEDWKNKYDELELKTIALMKCAEKCKFLEDCLESKTNECYDLNCQIDKIREENSKHVSRIKERCSMQKRAFQAQISGLDMELMQLRENLNAAYKDREELKLRMQNEIINLEQKFSDSQLEIKNLKSHVNILKTSYSNMLQDINAMEDDEAKDKQQKNDTYNSMFDTLDTSFKLDCFRYGGYGNSNNGTNGGDRMYCHSNDEDDDIEVRSNDIESALLTLRSLSNYTLKSSARDEDKQQKEQITDLTAEYEEEKRKIEFENDNRNDNRNYCSSLNSERDKETAEI